MKEQIEKQAIEEMACDMCTVILNCNEPCKPIQSCHAYQHAKRAYAKGYRKQSVGEWVKDAPHWRYHCNQCGFFPLMLHGDFLPFCPNCGAKMKGGAE